MEAQQQWSIHSGKWIQNPATKGNGQKGKTKQRGRMQLSTNKQGTVGSSMEDAYQTQNENICVEMHQQWVTSQGSDFQQNKKMRSGMLWVWRECGDH